MAQTTATASSIEIDETTPGPTIDRHIFGQFAEHLGRGVYEGIWVGPDSPIPNVRGIRTDVVEALRAIKVPTVRWPGGCFADTYHWRDGIGPAENRVSGVNTAWGHTLEPNTFGTDEFMDFLAQIGAEAYVSVNVGSGTPQEASEWLEYMTTDQPTTLGKARIANGHAEPYKVKFLGLGNENWGCGGAMSPEHYVEQMKRFSVFSRNFHPEQRVGFLNPRPQHPMLRIAVGPNAGQTEYTEAVMQAWANRERMSSWTIEGLSMHAYTFGSTPLGAGGTDFGEDVYAAFVKETYGMNALIEKHSAIMDKYDPRKKVALVIDEWGVWLKAKKDSNPYFLEQDTSLRDAILASINICTFARHAARVRMTNIAQMINVLQPMIETRGAEILLTPTYYVYKMYVPFQDAVSLPVQFDAGSYAAGETSTPALDAIAARDSGGRIWLSVTNIDPNKAVDVPVNLTGAKPTRASGQTLTAEQIDTINTFDSPSKVAPVAFNAEAKGGALVLRLPPKSVTVVRLDG